MKKTLNNNERRKIAIFGLSANPPSGKSGHLGIVEYLASTQLFDEIWILPVYSHALVAKRSLEPYHHRIEMCRLNFEQLSTSELPIKVSELEMELHSLRSPHIIHEQELVTIGTVDMIHHIQSYNPSLDLHLVLGTDTFNDLANGKWKESERVMKSASLEVVERTGAELHELAFSGREDYAIRVHRVPWLEETSSTAIRAALLTGKDDELLNGRLEPQVLKYIRDHHLYE